MFDSGFTFTNPTTTHLQIKSKKFRHRVLDHLHGSLPEGFLSPFDYVKIEKIQLQVIEEYRL